MNYLIDTQIILWLLSNDSKLSKRVIEIITDLNNVVYFSQISLIEITIKLKLGKLKLHVDLPIISQVLQNDGYEQLNIHNKHILSYQYIPLYDNHRDPFDRLIIATAFSENLTLITSDDKFILYQNLIPLVIV